MKNALFPASFNPITNGHEHIILRSLNIFDKIYVAVLNNSQKDNLFDIYKRIEIVKNTFEKHQNIEVITYSGITAQYCKENDIKFLIRGLRTSADFEFERAIAIVNRELNEELDTCFMMSDKEYSMVSSTIVRDVIMNGGDPKKFVPEKSYELIVNAYKIN